MKKTYLKKKLDKIFSEYIRLTESKNGYCKCCTCGSIKEWKDMDNGHYIGRGALSTRYLEKNCHPQCRKCNRFLEGVKDQYALYLINRYGDGILQELNEERNKIVKLSDEDYLELIDMYKHKVNQLKQEGV